ncbi:hypothetical protein L208DRAFT_1296155 [Tricholoma matsutake]|nr:hypothetical protein L208DRAFT_1296155 [Tricholoma matsutake 945]
MLKADRDAQLTLQRNLSLHGTAHCPIYVAPSFPAFSFLNILNPVCASLPCYGEPSVFPVLSPDCCLGEQLVNPALLSLILAVPCSSYCTKTPCSFSCVSPLSIEFHYLLLFLVLLLLVNTTVALPTLVQSELSICVLNTNGLMSPVKLALIGPLLMKLSPHIFTLLETKTQTNAAANLLIHNYEIFEEKAVPCAAPSHLAKWGIILVVHKDLQIVTHVPLNHKPLMDHVVCVDVTYLRYHIHSLITFSWFMPLVTPV